MRIAPLVATVLATILCAGSTAGAADAASIDSGTITVGEGVDGATLGMKHKQVVDILGRPVEENPQGVMSYQDWEHEDAGIFDIYRDLGNGKRVRMFMISGFRGNAFKLQDGNAIFARGGIDRLLSYYGARVKRAENKREGIKSYYIASELEGRKVITDFQVDRFSRKAARVLNVVILFDD